MSPLPIVRPDLPALREFDLMFEDCLKSGQVTNDGRFVRAFENSLSAYLGQPTLAFCNGQSALIAMLASADIKPGDEVLISAFGFPATAQAVRLLGATPVFVDIDDSLTMCPGSAEAHIRPATKAILATDAYGICCDYEALARLGSKYGLALLYDSAPAFGSLVKGTPSTKRATAQMFSFHATKPFTTMEGGALCGNPWLIEKARNFRNFGQTLPGAFEQSGFNGKMTEICGIIGLKQMQKWQARSALRRAVAADLLHQLSEIPGLILPKVPADQQPIWTYIPAIVDRYAFGMDRDALHEVLSNHLIQTRKYYSPALHLLYGAGLGTLRMAEKAASSVLALPIYSDMSTDERTRLISALKQIQRGN